MGERVDDAIAKCVKSMVADGIDPKEAKSRCIGKFKKTGNLKRKGPGLKESKKKPFKKSSFMGEDPGPPPMITRTSTSSKITGDHRHRIYFDIYGNGYSDMANEHSHQVSAKKILFAAGHTHGIDEKVDEEFEIDAQ